MAWPGMATDGNVAEMPGMKISLDAAMRARDVSRPTGPDETAAAELGSDSAREVASPPAELPGQNRRPRPRARPRPGHGSAGSSPDSS
jgi:hypothetical protein